MAEFNIFIPVELEQDQDIDVDMCQAINALIGQAVPSNTGVSGRIVTDIIRIYFSQYTATVLVLAKTIESP